MATLSEARDTVQRLKPLRRMLDDIEQAVDFATSVEDEAQARTRQITELRSETDRLIAERDVHLQAASAAQARGVAAVAEAEQATKAVQADYEATRRAVQREHTALVERLLAEITALDAQRDQAQAAVTEQQAELARVTQATEDARKVLRQLASVS